jgi:hypothetical protein
MSRQILTYADRAEQCEQMALRVRDLEAASRFLKLARYWRTMARQADEAARKTAGQVFAVPAALNLPQLLRFPAVARELPSSPAARSGAPVTVGRGPGDPS